MQKLYSDLSQMCNTLGEELSKANMKVDKAGGELSAGDLEYVDKLTHALKSVKTTKAMLESEMGIDGSNGMGYGYSRYDGPYMGGMNGSYADRRGNSYAQGRRGSRRDSMGRYSRNSSYDNEEMISELRELMEVAPDEKTRMEFDRFIKKIEQM